jgi:hypothetical protein
MKYILIVILAFFLITSCKKEIAPENPCDSYIRPSAKIFFEPLGIATPYNDNLTVWQELQFKSEFSDTNKYKHTWYLGAEIIHDAKFWRDFTDEAVPKTYIIYHTMRWEPNKLCDPLDQGFDSASYTFTITNKYNDLNIIGKYRVAFDSLPYDSMDIEFYFSDFNYIDSVIKNPMQDKFSYTAYDGDRGLAYQIKMRMKGLYLPSFDGRRVPINEQIEFAIIGSNYIPFTNLPGISPIEGPGGLIINPQNKQCELQFYYFGYKYSLKGRKL